MVNFVTSTQHRIIWEESLNEGLSSLGWDKPSRWYHSLGPELYGSTNKAASLHSFLSALDCGLEVTTCFKFQP